MSMIVELIVKFSRQAALLFAAVLVIGYFWFHPQGLITTLSVLVTVPTLLAFGLLPRRFYSVPQIRNVCLAGAVISLAVTLVEIIFLHYKEFGPDYGGIFWRYGFCFVLVVMVAEILIWKPDSTSSSVPNSDTQKRRAD